MFICIKIDLALNNLQRLICPKTKPNQTKLNPNVTQVSFSFIFTLWSLKTIKLTRQQILFFLLIKTIDFFTFALADGLSLEFE